jgi:uncharacterized protein (DUF885 family)
LNLEGHRFPGHLQPISQFYAMPVYFVQLGSGAGVHPFETVGNYDDFLRRVDDFVVIVEQAIVNMRIGIREGVVRPRILIDKALPQIASQIVDSAAESPFFNPIRNMPEQFGKADRVRLTAAYTVAIEE